jgi:hypothetical protein
VTNKESYRTTNSGYYSTYTRHSNGLHLPQTNLAIYQKEVHYSGVKIFNNFSSDIKNTSGNLKKLKRILNIS